MSGHQSMGCQETPSLLLYHCLPDAQSTRRGHRDRTYLDRTRILVQEDPQLLNMALVSDSGSNAKRDPFKREEGSQDVPSRSSSRAPTPKTPIRDESGQGRRESKGGRGESTTTTPIKLPRDPFSRTPSSPSPLSSPSKRKREEKEDEGCTPARSRGSKWAHWEDVLINRAIVSHGERAVDWHSVLSAINSKRGPEEGQRTMCSLKHRWMDCLKPKLVT